MMRSPLAAIALMVLPSFGHAEQCRQALALGLDVSGSVDSHEYRLQLDGLSAALLHPSVVQALLSMPKIPVRLAVYEWSGPSDQTPLLPWTTLNSKSTLTTITQQLTQTMRTPSEQSTGLGNAMLYGAALLSSQSHCWSRTLDISGDGIANTGVHPKDLSDNLFADITINGLVVGSGPFKQGDNRQAEIGELSSYFKTYVTHGPNSFVEVAMGFEDYERAMVRKLLRELEGLALSEATLTDQ